MADASGTKAPALRPLRTHDRAAVAVGCGVWAVLLALCLVGADRLEASGRGWWLWTCVAGLVLGLGGLAFLQWRHRSGRDRT